MGCLGRGWDLFSSLSLSLTLSFILGYQSAGLGADPPPRSMMGGSPFPLHFLPLSPFLTVLLTLLPIFILKLQGDASPRPLKGSSDKGFNSHLSSSLIISHHLSSSLIISHHLSSALTISLRLSSSHHLTIPHRGAFPGFGGQKRRRQISRVLVRNDQK